MKAVLQLFLQICLLRASPSAVPTAAWFVAAVWFIDAAITVVLHLVVLQEQLLDTVATVVVAQATMAGLVYGALYLQNMPQRFVATITALFGCDALIAALHLATIPMLGLISQEAANNSGYPFSIWSIVVLGFILHRALNVSMPAGVAIGFGAMIVSFVFTQAALA